MRSIEVSLLDPKVTEQVPLPIAVEPGRTVPSQVAPELPVAQPAVEMLVALGTVTLTTVDDAAPPAGAIDATIAATTAIAHATEGALRFTSSRIDTNPVELESPIRLRGRAVRADVVSNRPCSLVDSQPCRQS